MNRLVLVAVALVPMAANAADPCTGNLSPDQILGCLAPAPKTRGFPKSRGISVQGEQPAAAETTVNLMVNFDFNSARLTNDGMISLDALGKALIDPALRDAHFRIAGHTDAVGSDAANLRLSEQRAASVRAYLIGHFALDAGKFDVVGYGKSQLYDAADPDAAVNRRVQVTKLN